MSQVLGLSNEISQGNAMSERINDINREIANQNRLNLKDFKTKKASDISNANDLKTGLEVQEGEQGGKGAEQLGGLYDDLFGGKAGARAVGYLGQRAKQVSKIIDSTTSAINKSRDAVNQVRTAFNPETLPNGETEAGDIDLGFAERASRNLPELPQQAVNTLGTRASLASQAPQQTATDDGEALRQAEALPDKGLEGENYVELKAPSAGTGFTVDAGRGLGLTGTDMGTLELPLASGDLPRTFTAPAYAEVARRAGRTAFNQGEGGILGRLSAGERAVVRARQGESFENITGLQDTIINPASRISAGPGRRIIPAVRDEAPDVSELEEDDGAGVGEIPPAGSFRPAPTETAPAGETAPATTNLTELRLADERANAPATPPQEDITPPETQAPVESAPKEDDIRPAEATGDSSELVSGAEDVAKNVGAFGNIGSKIATGLRVAGVAGGVYDTVEDIKKKGIAGDNIASKISNVAGIAGGIAGGLELAGATADATGILAPIGVGVQALGAVAGATALVAGGIGDIIDDIKGKKKVDKAINTAKSEAPPPMIKPIAQQATGLTGSYVGQASSALTSGRGGGSGAF